jgi:hypothetical protein
MQIHHYGRFVHFFQCHGTSSQWHTLMITKDSYVCGASIASSNRTLDHRSKETTSDRIEALILAPRPCFVNPLLGYINVCGFDREMKRLSFMSPTRGRVTCKLEMTSRLVPWTAMENFCPNRAPHRVHLGSAHHSLIFVCLPAGTAFKTFWSATFRVITPKSP